MAETGSFADELRAVAGNMPSPTAEDSEPSTKRPRLEGDDAPEPGSELNLDDEFDVLLGGEAPSAAHSAEVPAGENVEDDDLLMQQLLAPPPPDPPEEQARRSFAESLERAEKVSEEALPGLLEKLRDVAPSWGELRRMRSLALLLVYVSRSSRPCRAALVAEGLPLLGQLLSDSVAALEAGSAAERQEAGMRALACIICLASLPLGRATMWEYRLSLGKAFDRLHRWCGREKSALAAELRAPTQALCRRWRQQPKPVQQEKNSPEKKAVRVKVLEIIKQGVLGLPGCSPASPVPMSLASPAPGLPVSTVSAEIEAALFGLYGGATADYRAHARMLRNNLSLAGNTSLRTRVLSGEVGAEELVKMDSKSLAPESLQEQRRADQLEAMRSVVAKSPIIEAPAPSDGFDWRDSTYNPSTSREELEPPDEAASKSSAEPPPPVAMEPPPTPFLSLEGPPPTPLRGGGGVPPPTPEALATPAPEDDDEQVQELIRFFSQKVA